MIKVKRLNNSTFTIRGVGFKDEVTIVGETEFRLIEHQLRRVEEMGLISIEIDRPTPKPAPVPQYIPADVEKSASKNKRTKKKRATKKRASPKKDSH